MVAFETEPGTFVLTVSIISLLCYIVRAPCVQTNTLTSPVAAPHKQRIQPSIEWTTRNNNTKPFIDTAMVLSNKTVQVEQIIAALR